VWDHYTVERSISDIAVTLEIFHCPGLPEYDRLRPLSYPQTDVFLLCFSIMNPESYESVRTKWYPEVIHHGRSTAKILLVGTKLDLRDNPETLQRLADRQMAPVSYAQGIAMSKDIGVSKYCECSAFTRQGLDNVFQEAVLAVIDSPPPPAKAKK
ncbi:P-loop containing nucleoside triphosphate hydrolase protein, partial [Gymnopilus junonius]